MIMSKRRERAGLLLPCVRSRGESLVDAGDEEKEQFRHLLDKVLEFSGLEAIGWCCLSILRYNKSVQKGPAGGDPIFQRSGYVHPVYNSAGQEVTLEVQDSILSLQRKFPYS